MRNFTTTVGMLFGSLGNGGGAGGVLDAWLKVSRDFLVLLTVWPDALAIENVAAAFIALLGGRKSDKMRGNLCCLFFFFKKNSFYCEILRLLLACSLVGLVLAHSSAWKEMYLGPKTLKLVKTYKDKEKKRKRDKCWHLMAMLLAFR